MPSDNDIVEIQACVLNRWDRKSIGKKRITGIIGDAPSHYAKSPYIWNTVFQDFAMDVCYLPFDVEETQLPRLVQALRKCKRFMGANVTVPYKIKIIEYLDSLDESTAKIGAVNTIIRTQGGTLVGSNTDGSGFLASIVTSLPGEQGPFLRSLNGVDTLIIGAGGSARAVAFHLADALGDGHLYICNRTADTARDLASDLKQRSRRVTTISEEELYDAAFKVGLIVNCSTKGQGGLRTNQDGKITILEPYSALAPARPAIRAPSENGQAEFYRDLLADSLPDIEANNHASWKLALTIPSAVAFCDLIYFPPETVFLRHARLTGHRTLNGKGMNVAQAADAFFYQICRDHLKELGTWNRNTYKRLFRIMYDAW